MTWGGVTCEMTWCVALRDAIDQTWLNKTRGQFTKVMVAKKLNPRSKRCDLKLQRRKRYNIEPLSMICLSYSATKAWVIFSVVFVEKKKLPYPLLPELEVVSEKSVARSLVPRPLKSNSYCWSLKRPAQRKACFSTDPSQANCCRHDPLFPFRWDTRESRELLAYTLVVVFSPRMCLMCSCL